MSSGSSNWLLSFAPVTLVFWVLLLGLARGLRFHAGGARWTLGCGGLALVLAFLPVAGFPLARVVTGFGWVPSFPLLALLADTVVRHARGRGWLQPAEQQTAWLWGALAGLALYPSALGLGRFDAYALGWGFTVLGVLVATLSVWLIWRGNRFGIVLVLATLDWQGGTVELANFSANYWDYLVDPVYFATSVLALARSYAAARGTTASRKRQAGAQPQGS
jgi:hypothetical protein